MGTVQFGLPYGIANAGGQVGESQVEEMLDFARSANIDTLDTAAAYGSAEQLLGSLGVDDFRVVTKIPTLPKNLSSVANWICETVETSIERLRLSRLHGLLLHDADDLAGPHGGEIVDSLMSLKAKGLVDSIGVSIYRPSQLTVVMSLVTPDLVQAPMNVFDRRLATTGWLDRLCSAGTKVHIRSAFLQGLLLMPPNKLPLRFAPWLDRLQSWHSWVRECGVSPTAACLAHVMSFPGIDRVVVGCDSCEQLREIVRDASAKPVVAPIEMETEDEQLTNPATWGSR